MVYSGKPFVAARGEIRAVIHLVSLIGMIFPGFTNLSSDSITYKIDTLLVILIAIDLHELGHALVADRLGDDTPRLAGHMTLNPFRKMDQFGIIMLIILSFSGRGFTYGFTPVNEVKLRQRTEFGPALVALSGPLMNLLIAVVVAIPITTSTVYGLSDTGSITASLYGSQPLFDFLNLMLFYNVFLFVINLIPLPPLDGWTILSAFFTAKTRYELRTFVMYGPFILLLLFVFDNQIHFFANTIDPLVSRVMDLLARL